MYDGTLCVNDVSFPLATALQGSLMFIAPSAVYPVAQGSVRPSEQELLVQVEVLSGKRRGGRDAARSPQELPFSEDAKRVFEAALTVRPPTYRPSPP